MDQAPATLLREGMDSPDRCGSLACKLKLNLDARGANAQAAHAIAFPHVLLHPRGANCTSLVFSTAGYHRGQIFLQHAVTMLDSALQHAGPL